MGFLQILGIFGNVAVQVAASLAGLTPATTTLIDKLLTGATTLVGSLAQGNTKLQDVLAALAALSSVIAALKADPAIAANSDKLALLTNLDGEISAAINAYIIAGKGYDPANYAPVTPVQ